MPRTFLCFLASLSLLGLAACSAEGDSRDVDLEPKLGVVTSALTSTVEPVASFGSNPGALKLYAYVPKPLPANAPLVLVLHGCSQSSVDAAKWGWNELADQYGFVVGYPEQQTANNTVRCFNWGGEYGNLANLQRDQGENLSIKQMADALVAQNGLDAKRVFISGFSAGGATALVAAATYPDVFAGVASLSGIPYACNANYSEVFTCQNPGVDRTAAEWGTRVRAAFPGFTGPYPRISIWQGTADTTVGTKNRAQSLKQWTDVHGLPETASETLTVDGAKRELFKNGAGEVLVEGWEIPGMSHGVAVAPAQQCGTASTFAFDKGVCQAARVIEFFGITSATGVPTGDGGTTTPTSTDAGATKPPGSTPSGATPPGSGPAAAGAAPSANKDGFGDSRSPGSTCSAAPGPSPSRFGFVFAIAIAALALASRRGSRTIAGDQ